MLPQAPLCHAMQKSATCEKTNARPAHSNFTFYSLSVWSKPEPHRRPSVNVVQKILHVYLWYDVRQEVTGLALADQAKRASNLHREKKPAVLTARVWRLNRLRGILGV